MDEYDSGMDPAVRKFFKKILNSFGAGLLWMMVMATAGLYFRLALTDNGWHWYNVLFYGLFAGSFAGLIYYLWKLWKG